MITDITVVKDGCCKGEFNGNTETFPESFVKFLEETPPSSAKSIKKEKKIRLKLLVAITQQMKTS